MNQFSRVGLFIFALATYGQSFMAFAGMTALPGTHSGSDACIGTGYNVSYPAPIQYSSYFTPSAKECAKKASTLAKSKIIETRCCSHSASPQYYCVYQSAPDDGNIIAYGVARCL